MKKLHFPRYTRPLPSALALGLTLALWATPLMAQEGMMMDEGEDEGGITGPLSAPEFAPGTGATGMGRAQNAVSVGTNGVFNNPAGISRAYMYALEGKFIYTPTGNVLSTAIVDSQTNPRWSGGVGFGYYFSSGEETDLKGIDVRVATAFPVVQDRVSIGLGGRYLRFKSDEVEVMNGFSLDAGVIFKLVDQLSVGIAAKNLLDPCERSECRGWVPMTIGGGVTYGTPEFALALDVDADLNSASDVVFNFETGGEYLAAQMVPIRVGYRRLGALGSNRITAGSGWRSKTAGMDLSYEHDLSYARFGELLLGVSVYF